MKQTDYFSLHLREYFTDETKIKTDIRSQMVMRYIIISFAGIFLFVFRHALPFPFPQFFIVSCASWLSNMALHLLSFKKNWLKRTYGLYPYIDAAIAPFIFQCTGGFLSPFVITHIASNIASCIVYTRDRDLALRTLFILLAGYLGVAFLQKFQVLPIYLDYARTMMANDAFFYFVTIITTFIITAAYFIVQVLNFHIHQMLDEMSKAFDSIIRGTIATVGQDFFVHLAKNLVESLKVRSCIIGELSNKNQSLRTLAVWKENVFETGFEIPLKDTVFSKVLLDGRCTVTAGLNMIYPANPFIDNGASDFFFGTVLYDSKAQPIGMLCLMNDRPPQNMYLVEPLLSIFVSRASAELERKLTEDRRARVEMQLAQAQKMAAIGQLVGGIAHDFNNMINAISGYAQLLRVKLDPHSPFQNHVHHIITASGRTADLVSQLTHFARRGSPQQKPVHVHDLLDETIVLLERTINRNIAISRRYAAQNPFTAGDATFLQNVFLNLGINARDAMEGNGGEILFTTSEMVIDAAGTLCQSFNIGPGNYLSIGVSDTGAGMSDEVLGHLFEPFFTTKPKGKGTGLGLANVWGYIENFKGAIEVKSEEKKGTTFTLYLPSAGDLARLPMPVKKEIRFSQPLPGVIKKILVVDDEEALREICGEILAFAGYEFSLCENGVDALDFMKKDGASIDLVVLDMMMPRMNGHDTFYALRGIKPDLKIILTSGFLDEKEFKGILNEPNIAFVQKPFTDKELLGGISSLCRTGPTGRARHPAGHVARQA